MNLGQTTAYTDEAYTIFFLNCILHYYEQKLNEIVVNSTGKSIMLSQGYRNENCFDQSF